MLIRKARKWLKKLSASQRYIFLASFIAFFFSFAGVLFFTFLSTGSYVPEKGGSYVEGVIGSPRFINPILAPANEVDRALVKLIFPSLVTYTSKGDIVPYAAKDINVLENGKVYEFILRNGMVWEDGKPFSAQDVVFTVSTIQNEKIASPLNRIWSGVKAEAIGSLKVRFSLPHPYAFFLQNATLGILPSHIWGSIPPSEFANSEYNAKPIGAGPYRLQRLSRINGAIVSAILKENPTYFGQKPFIPEILFEFYPDSKQLVDAYEKEQVQSIPVPSISLYTELAAQKNTKVYTFMLPRYFALFLNEKANPVLGRKEVRQALAYAIQKKKIISDILGSQAQGVTTPIVPALKNYYKEAPDPYEYNPQKAKELLKKAGFEKKPLAIELTLIDNDSLTEVAQKVIRDWQAIGVNTTIKHVGLDKLREEILQKREYQVFLFGQSLALEPDPFSLWHSSQQQSLGLNLSSYKNPKMDKLLEDLRQTTDVSKQKEFFVQFQSIMTQDVPAIFLYSPYQLFMTRDNIKGIIPGVLSLPEDRFNQVADWYINTKRIK